MPTYRDQTATKVPYVEKSGMDLLVPPQHCYKLFNSASASLRPFRGLNSPKNRIPVRPVKPLKKRCGLGIGVQRSLKVIWHRRTAW
jgi:hypothetical protein